MSKLLAANFSRLKKDKVFWIGMLFMAALGIFMRVASYLSMKRTGYVFSLDSGFFSYAAFIIIAASVFCSLFTGTEYSDGTIRNKIVVGHTRISVYLSNLIACAAADFFLCLSYLISALAAGIPLLGFFQTDIKIIVVFILDIFVMTLAFSAIYTFIAMLCQNKAITAVICILGAFIFLFCGSYINARLEEPETYGAYTFTAEGQEISEEAEPNPNYLDGTKRKVYEFLYDFLPGGQAIQLSSMTAVHLWQLPLYSCIITILCTGFGIVFFRRKDLL